MMEGLYIPELHALEHKHDSDVELTGVLARSLSPVVYKNPTLGDFLDLLGESVDIMSTHALQVRNSMNHAVEKYYNGHAR
jgi:hypothetical protein